MWAFKTLWDKGLVYEGFRVLPYCWRCETPLSQHRDADGRRLPRPAGPGASRSASSCRRPASRRELLWSGRRRRGRCRRTWRSRSGPTSSTRVRRATDGRALRARRGAARRATPRELGEADACRRRCTGSELRRAPLHAAVRLLRDGRRHRTPSRCSPPTSSPPRTAPGVVHIAPGFGEDDQVVVRRGRASRPSSRSTSTAGSPPRSPPYAGMQVFDANPPIIRDLKERGVRACATRPTTTPTRTAGAATRR